MAADFRRFWIVEPRYFGLYRRDARQRFGLSFLDQSLGADLGEIVDLGGPYDDRRNAEPHQGAVDHDVARRMFDQDSDRCCHVDYLLGEMSRDRIDGLAQLLIRDDHIEHDDCRCIGLELRPEVDHRIKYHEPTFSSVRLTSSMSAKCSGSESWLTFSNSLIS